MAGVVRKNMTEAAIYVTGAIGGLLLFLTALHVYAWWTIRHLDEPG